MVLVYSSNFESIFDKELFIDFDWKCEFLIYLIDHKKKVFVPYIHQYAIGLYDFIMKKRKQFDITAIGLYGISGGMRWLYDELIQSGYVIYDRSDIFEWRMSLDQRIKIGTKPMFYYEAKGYQPLSEKEYLTGIKY